MDTNRLPLALYTDEGRAAILHLQRANKWLTYTVGRHFGERSVTLAKAHNEAAQAILGHEYSRYRNICNDAGISQYYT